VKHEKSVLQVERQQRIIRSCVKDMKQAAASERLMTSPDDNPFSVSCNRFTIVLFKHKKMTRTGYGG